MLARPSVVEGERPESGKDSNNHYEKVGPLRTFFIESKSPGIRHLERGKRVERECKSAWENK